MTGKQRLEVMGKYLVSGAVDEDEFNMNNWASCAINEGQRLPAFQKEGLSTVENGESPAYEGEDGFEAISKFFRIPFSIATKLFGADNDDSTLDDHRSAVTVGRQILKYIKKSSTK